MSTSAPAPNAGQAATSTPAETTDTAQQAQQGAQSAPTPATVAAFYQQQATQPAARPGSHGPQVFSSDYVEALRGENASYRTRARDAETQAAEALKARDAEIAELKKQLQAAAPASEELATLRTDQVLGEILAELGGAPVARAALKGDGVLKDIDLANDDGRTAAKAAIDKYLTEHPELKAAQGAPRSGVPTPGGSGEGAGAPPASLAAALDQHYNT